VLEADAFHVKPLKRYRIPQRVIACPCQPGSVARILIHDGAIRVLIAPPVVSSYTLYGQHEHVAGAPNGADNALHLRAKLQFTPEAQDLNVDRAVA
jgi:hypothetical protein